MMNFFGETVSVRDTSLQAFSTVDVGKAQAQVFQIIKDNPDICNKEIKELLGWEINRITPRVKELRQKGLVIESGTKIYEDEKLKCRREVLIWKINNPYQIKHGEY